MGCGFFDTVVIAGEAQQSEGREGVSRRYAPRNNAGIHKINRPIVAWSSSANPRDVFDDTPAAGCLWPRGAGVDSICRPRYLPPIQHKD